MDLLAIVIALAIQIAVFSLGFVAGAAWCGLQRENKRVDRLARQQKREDYNERR